MKYTPRMPRGNANVTPTSPLRDFFVLAGGLLGIVVGLYLALGLVVDLIVPRISLNVEDKIGEMMVGIIPPWDKGSESAEAVQQLLDDLQKRCTRLDYGFRVIVTDDEAINAIALPGGNIVVFRGLLEKMTSENELTFVLAHELGHYANKDHLRGIGRSLVFMVIGTVLIGPDSSVGKMLGHAAGVTELSFSRKQETRADVFALAALNCAYGHVGGATDFFDKISKEEDPGVFGHYFSTHPENRQRADHMKELARENGYTAGQLSALPETIRPDSD